MNARPDILARARHVRFCLATAFGAALSGLMCLCLVGCHWFPSRPTTVEMRLGSVERALTPRGALTSVSPPATVTLITLNVARGQREEVAPFWIDVVGSCNGLLWYDRTNDLTEQLAHLHNRLGVKELRFHNILSLVPEPADGKYDFSKVDRVYDAVRSAGVRPLVEVSFMPPWLASGAKTTFQYRANVTMPRDAGRWRDLVAAFARHLEERYGAAEVRTWRFEIWNEPDHPGFWDQSQGDWVKWWGDYLNLYVLSAKALRGVDPALRVGGPATATSGGGGVVQWFLEHLPADAPLDFVSSHLYGGGRADRRDPSKGYRFRSLTSLRERLTDEHNLTSKRHLPLVITEWNITASPRDGIHDEPLAAAFVLGFIQAARGRCDAVAYWAYTDLFAELGIPTSEFSGGFGLLSLRGIEKPVFKAFEMLNLTGGGQWVMPDEGDAAPALASWDEENRRLVVVFWNWPYDAGGVTTEAPAQPREVRIRLDGLPRGRWAAELLRMDATHANSYAAWRDMGSPPIPAPEQMDQLKSAAQLAPEPFDSPLSVGAATTLAWRPRLQPGDCYALVLRGRNHTTGLKDRR